MKVFVFLFYIVTGVIHLESSSLLQTSSSSFEAFSGTMTVQADTYEVKCDCSDDSIVELEQATCQPSKLKLTQEREGTGTTYEDLLGTLGSYKNYAYAKVTHSSFRCLDGRIAEGIMGTPGGDAGEFVLALLVYQDISGIKLTQDFVLKTLQEYLRCMGHSKFYMCTDEAALSHLAKELAVDSVDVLNPPEDLKSLMIKALQEPQNVGDTHLRMMIEHPELYSIEKEVIEMFIAAFFTVLWDSTSPLGSTLFLDVLKGSHMETGFLEIRVNEECLNELVTPLVAPTSVSEPNVSLLVNHIDAAGTRRQQLAQFFVEKIGFGKKKVSVQSMVSRLNHHGLLFLDVTGSYISKNLPFFTAEFV